MARVDYEAAWFDLLDVVRSKTGHGSKDLLAEAARIASENRVPEDLVERVVRVYGRTGLEALIPNRPEVRTSDLVELRDEVESEDPGASKSNPHKEELTDGIENRNGARVGA